MDENKNEVQTTEERKPREWKWWDDPTKVAKLEQAFAIGCDDKEAVNFAEISLDQLYYYSREINKDFQARKEQLKERPILKAKETIVKNLTEVQNAQWYLERKKKDEFSSRQELTGKNGEDLKINSLEQSLVILAQQVSLNGTNPTRVNLPETGLSTLQDAERGAIPLDQESMQNLSNDIRENESENIS